MHELFDHTADLGLRVRAAELRQLFEEAAVAVSAAMVARFDAVQPRQQEVIRVEGTAHDELLVDWLGELVFRFAARGWIGCRFAVVVDERGLGAEVCGEPYDEARHGAGQELKAITYHGLRVEQDDDGWIAEVVIDL